MSESQEKVLDLRSVFGFQATVTILSAATEGEYGELDCTLEPGAIRPSTTIQSKRSRWVA